MNNISSDTKITNKLSVIPEKIDLTKLFEICTLIDGRTDKTTMT